MKNRLIIFSIMILTFFACNKPTFNVDVEITNANGKTIYLQKLVDNKFVDIDSAVVENQHVIFNVEKSANNDAYHIFVKGWRRALPFFSDNEDVVINGDFNNYNKISIKASQTQQLLDSINGIFYDLDENAQDKIITDFVKNKEVKSHDELGSYLIYRYKWLFNLAEIKELMTYFDKESKASYLDQLNEYITLLERTEVGSPYIDFTLNDVDGQAVTLSSIVGNHKLVMIDFWAAWCPDCRVENPNIVAVYNDFKDKGLEIISVSLDADKNTWMKAIADDNLLWKNHVSELKGWNCSAAKEYGVSFIPQNFIIDTDGKIVAKNLSGNDLRVFVENYLK